MATSCLSRFRSTLNPIYVELAPFSKYGERTSEYRTCLTLSSEFATSLGVIKVVSFADPILSRSSILSNFGDSGPPPPAEGGTGDAKDLRGRLSKPFNSSSDDIFQQRRKIARTTSAVLTNSISRTGRLDNGFLGKSELAVIYRQYTPGLCRFSWRKTFDAKLALQLFITP